MEAAKKEDKSNAANNGISDFGPRSPEPVVNISGLATHVPAVIRTATVLGSLCKRLLSRRASDSAQPKA